MAAAALPRNGSRNKRPDWAELAESSPETPMGVLLRRFWQPVAASSDVEAGKATQIHLFNEYFTLYRGEGGEPHLVAQRCAHRCTELRVGWVEGDCIRCFYHGWKYDGTGQCVEQPAEE
ncbi:MAG TPA: Rieske 2Fe-2S domain-containing protein, partial [Chloroflexota bacterium]|nr:Rieske 2Fe-2S domain-containing protein [Chloroflexota bacterium]